MGKLRNVISLPSMYLGIIQSLNVQKSFLKTYISPLLDFYKINNDVTLTEKDFVKINKYYGLAVPAILGEAFCKLRNKPLTIDERWVLTCQGIITGLFDDFFDDSKLPYDYIQNIVVSPKTHSPATSNEKLFVECYLKALKLASHPHLITSQFLLVHNDQIDSVEQENISVLQDRVWEITQNKGGNSVLFYRTSLDNLMDIKEKEALFHLGSLMQLENDIFDVYKDNSIKIYTLATIITNIEDLRQLYQNQVNLFISASYKMNYPKKQIIRFLDNIMPVINRGFVCLDQYQKLQNSNNYKFIVEDFSRKQLICDMELPKNIFKTTYYQIVSPY